ncbi:PqqD family protein [candidate division KSB1 bacterium]|nr:PqqD family protein [candidate division KSB1 bacterium]
MSPKINLDHIYCQSPDVVSREIEGTIVIIPITAGIGDLENELFSLNDTGKVLWHKLDGTRTLKEIVIELEDQFQSLPEIIEKDVVGLLTELLKRQLILDKSEG